MSTQHGEHDGAAEAGTRLATPHASDGRASDARASDARASDAHATGADDTAVPDARKDDPRKHDSLGGIRDIVVRAVGAALVALEKLAGGFGTALLALFTLGWLAVAAVTTPVGIGLLMAPVGLRLLHAVADRERGRLNRWGPELVGPGPAPTQLRPALTDPTTRRELSWLVRHATVGLFLGLIGVLLPLCAIRDSTFPLYWKLLPDGATSASIGLGVARGWSDVLAVALLGLGWIAIIMGLTPGMARLQAGPGRRLLSVGPDADLSLRIAELTATRAAALDAHATELRRIERSLHDGTQNRLVTVTVLLGAARRMVARDPAGAEELLERAHSSAEQALAELRSVARGILPPVLTDRGLEGALTGLAASCPVPCRIDVEAPERRAASVEATAYFVVAEALTNIAKHSHAEQADVTVRGGAGKLHLRISDNGRGGADESGGSGLVGIRRRIAALDGTLTVASPPGGPTTLKVELPCGS